MRELSKSAQALPASGQAGVPVPFRGEIDRWQARGGNFVIVAFRSGLLEEGIA